MKLSTCKKDGFPTIMLDGLTQCVAEYLDRCIGGQTVMDVIMRDEALFYVFENGHELPLFCFCCDSPLQAENMQETKEEVAGMYLQSMAWHWSPDESGIEHLEYFFELARPDEEDSLVQISTSVKSAQEIIHPPGCPHRKKDVPSAKEQKTKKIRKRHKRAGK